MAFSPIPVSRIRGIAPEGVNWVTFAPRTTQSQPRRVFVRAALGVNKWTLPDAQACCKNVCARIFRDGNGGNSGGRSIDVLDTRRTAATSCRTKAGNAVRTTAAATTGTTVPRSRIRPVPTAAPARVRPRCGGVAPGRGSRLRRGLHCRGDCATIRPRHGDAARTSFPAHRLTNRPAARAATRPRPRSCPPPSHDRARAR